MQYRKKTMWKSVMPIFGLLFWIITAKKVFIWIYFEWFDSFLCKHHKILKYNSLKKSYFKGKSFVQKKISNQMKKSQILKSNAWISMSKWTNIAIRLLIIKKKVHLDCFCSCFSCNSVIMCVYFEIGIVIIANAFDTAHIKTFLCPFLSVSIILLGLISVACF